MNKVVGARSAARVAGRSRAGEGRKHGRSLLLLTSALGCSLMVVAAPIKSHAAEECGAGASVVCAPGTYSSGVSYTGVGAFQLNVPAGATVTNSGAYAHGVFVTGSDGAVSVTTENVAVTGNSAQGVFVQTTSGDVTLDVGATSTSGDTVFDDVANPNHYYADAVTAVTTSGDISIVSDTASSDGLYTSAIAGLTTDGGDIFIDSGEATSGGPGGVVISAVAMGDTGAVTIIADTVTASGVGTLGIEGYAAGDLSITSRVVNGTNGVFYDDVLEMEIEGHAIAATSLSGDVTINSGEITTGGAVARGIFAQAHAGAVTITSENITTTGGGAAGVLVTAGSEVSITSGSIATSGDYTAMDAEHLPGGIAVSGVGAVTIVSETVTTTGDGGFGIAVEEAASVSIDSGDVATSGVGASGIYAGAEGAITIVSDSVSTTGGWIAFEDDLISANGIDAESVAGPVSITSTTVNTSGDHAIGIAVDAGSGLTTINSGTVATEGMQAHGIYVEGATGDVVVNSTTLTTSGDSAQGIYAQTGTGNVAIDAGVTTVTGDTIFDPTVNPYGYYADAITAVTFGGAISITSDDVIANGLYTSAIAAVSHGGDILVDSGEASGEGFGGVVLQVDARGAAGGDVEVFSDSITVAGWGRGALGALGSGDVSVTSGSIVNTSVWAMDEVDEIAVIGSGLLAYSTGGDVTVHSGTISTVSDFGRGLAALSDAGSVVVTSQSVTTQSARGIQVRAANEINLTSGTVTVAGPGAHGITAQAGSGPAVINSTTITTSGAGSHGIYVANAGGADIAGIGTWRAATGGTGLLDINSGAIDASGWGMMIDHQGVIDIQSTSIASGGSGIYLYGGDAVTIDSGTIETENGAGIIVWGDDGLVTINSDDVTVGEGGDVGLFAQTTTGDIIIGAGVTRTTATGLLFGSYTADAVGAISDTGDISITSQQATTVGYATSGIYAFTDGAISVTSGMITAGGDDGNGMLISGDGAITIDSGIVTTTGANKDAIIVLAGAGDVLIGSDQINAQGASSNGIFVAHDDPTFGARPAAGGTGSLTIDSGTILATEMGIYVDHIGAIDITSDHLTSAGPGIYVYGAGAIDIDSGDVTSSAGPGIVVWGGEGNVSILTGATTAGATGDVGLFANTTSGDIVIDAGVTTTNNTGMVGEITADAVVAMSGSGDVSVTSGQAVAKGLYSSALVAVTAGDTVVHSGIATNSGESGNGLYVYGANVEVTSETVSTTGDGAAFGIRVSGAGQVAVESGAITTVGALLAGSNRAFGLLVDNSVGDTVVTSGTISTAGDRAYGLAANTSGADGDVSVDSGSIITAGAGARGLYAYNLGAGDVVVLSDSVTTTGGVYNESAASEGIRAQAGAGSIAVDSGSVSTQGAGAFGIVTTGGGAVSVISDEVETAGDGATGIQVTDAGSASVTTGDILVAGLDAHGLFVSTLGEDGDIDIEVAGAVSSAHGYGILASTEFAGAQVNIDVVSGGVSGAEAAIAVDGDNDVVLNVAGQLSTTGDVAVILGAGADVVTLQTGANVVGALYGGEGIDVLNLNSTVNTGVGIGQTMDDVIAFETLNVANGHWTLGGDAEMEATSITGGTLVLGGVLASDVVIGAGGTLQIGQGGEAGDLLGDLVVGGTVIFNRADEYDYAGALSGAGSLVKRGASRLVLSGDYNFTGATVVEGGTIKIMQLPDTAEVVVDDGVLDLSGQEQELGQLSGGEGGEVDIDGGALTLNQTTTTTFAGAITGDGALTLTGGGEINLTGANTYTGPTTIDQGTLRVNGSITSNVTVDEGGVLGGSGEITGDVVIAAGGVLGPGNSPGTMTVAGDQTFASGSTYQVEVEANGDHDLLIVGGETVIEDDVTLEILAGAGDYARLTRHTILTSAGGIDGRFADEISTNLAFLDPHLEYSDNAVDLVLVRNDVAFAAFGRNANQQAVAGAVEAGGYGDTLYDALVVQSAEGAAAGYGALSGELYAGLNGVLLQRGHHVRNAVLGHAGMDGEGPAMWGELIGSRSEFEGNDDYAGIESDAEGVAAGVESGFEGWRAGVAIALMKSDVESSMLASTADVESTTLSAYAGRQVGWLNATFGASYAWHSVEADRTVAFTGFADTTNAEFDATTTELFAEFALRGESAGTFFETFYGAALTRLDIDDVAEAGGPAALTLEGESQTVISQSLGVRAWHPVATGFGSVAPYASLAWRGLAGDTDTPLNATFGNGGGFAVAGAPLDESAFVLDLGVKVSGERFSVNAAYSAMDGEEWTDERLNIGVAFKF